MRKMDMLDAGKRARVWEVLERQYPDKLAERAQFGNLVAVQTLRDAAIIHCRYVYLETEPRVWNKAFEMRDNLITALDWEWPHCKFWEEVDRLEAM